MPFPAFLRLKLAAMSILAGSLVISACGENPHQGEFRYRLSFSVKVDGVVETASSIVAVRYWGGKGGMTTSAVTAFSEWEGVAPVLKIGNGGWLVAALRANNARFERLKGPYPPTCAEAADAASFPGVFEKSPKQLS